MFMSGVWLHLMGLLPNIGRMYFATKENQRTIRSTHVKTLQCAFCDYITTQRRKQRMVEHQMKKHNFPVPFRVHQASIAARARVRRVETVPVRPYVIEQPVAPPAVSVPSQRLPAPCVPPSENRPTVHAVHPSKISETVSSATCDMDLQTPETDAIHLDF